MDKNVLVQYCEMKEEIKDIRRRKEPGRMEPLVRSKSLEFRIRRSPGSKEPGSGTESC